MNSQNYVRMAISNLGCTLSGGIYVCLLPTTISNAKSITLIEAHVALPEYNNTLMVCLENVTAACPFFIKSGTANTDVIKTTMVGITNPRTITSHAIDMSPGVPAMTTEIYPSSINELRIAFRSGQNTIVAAGNPIILTRFLVILQFNF